MESSWEESAAIEEGKKPGQCLLLHGIILLGGSLGHVHGGCSLREAASQYLWTSPMISGASTTRRIWQGDRTILTRQLILSHSAFSAAPTTTPHERRRAQGRAPGPGRVSTPGWWGRQPSAAARGHEPACPAPVLPHWPQCFRSWTKAMV